jgi:phosphoglycolate phosphatase-like HAD superfamily hydrolase
MTRISYLPMSEVIAAVVFDLDGVLVDSESVWDAARREVVARNGGRWQADATRAMMGFTGVEPLPTRGRRAGAGGAGRQVPRRVDAGSDRVCGAASTQAVTFTLEAVPAVHADLRQVFAAFGLRSLRADLEPWRRTPGRTATWCGRKRRRKSITKEGALWVASRHP